MNAYSGPAPTPVGKRLEGKTIAVSVSEAHDLKEMGFADDQLDRVLQALLVPLVAEGARIAYGGRIEHPHNFTLVISDQLGEAYRRLDQAPGHRPFVHFLSQHHFAETAPEVLFAHLKILAPYGEAWVVGGQGVLGTLAAEASTSDLVAVCSGCGLLEPADMETGSGPEALASLPLYRAWQSLPAPDADVGFSDMRREMARLCDARVLLGGRKTRFRGVISGVCEEALLTIEASKPLVAMGGFGGASRDIAIALGMLDDAERVPTKTEADTAAYQKGLQQLKNQQQGFLAPFDPSELGVLKELTRTESTADGGEMLLSLLARCL